MQMRKETPTHYETLKISKSEKPDEIKKTYKKLALIYHPDKNPDDKENAAIKFREIQEAYEVLSDDDKRAAYDLTLPATEAKTYVSPPKSSFSYNNFFSPVKNSYVEAIALSADLDYSFVQACFDSQSDGRFERIVNLACYIKHNKKFEKKPSLSLDQAFATTLQESINLQRAYPLISDGFISIEQTKVLLDQQSDNISDIGIGVVREGLLKIHEVLSLSKIESDFLYEAYSRQGRYNLKEAVEALKIFQESSSTLQYK